MINRMVALVIIGAGLLAIAAYLVITSLPRTGPPADVVVPVEGETPADGIVTQPGEVVELVNVGDTAVTLSYPPEKEVRFLRDIEAEQAALQQQQQLDAQATLDAQQQEPPPEQLEPTPLPQIPAAEPAAPPLAVTGGLTITFIDYTVQPGDTLYRLTQNFNTTIELMAVHGIDAYDLEPGRVIRLPVANDGYCGANTAYVVQPGDTVFKIASRFNTTAEVIRSLNNLNESYRINVAQVICLP